MNPTTPTVPQPAPLVSPLSTTVNRDTVAASIVTGTASPANDRDRQALIQARREAGSPKRTDTPHRRRGAAHRARVDVPQAAGTRQAGNTPQTASHAAPGQQGKGRAGKVERERGKGVVCLRRSPRRNPRLQEPSDKCPNGIQSRSKEKELRDGEPTDDRSSPCRTVRHRWWGFGHRRIRCLSLGSPTVSRDSGVLVARR